MATEEGPRQDQQSLTIGEFGRRSGLSLKALRLYELSGLLPPAAVDPVTGYRRYGPEQLERAQRISLLRRLDMPLATISEVLAGDDDLALQRLDRWWAEQETLMRTRQDALEYLRAKLIHTHVPGPTYSLRLREVAEAKVAAIRRDVDQADLVLTMVRCAAEIRRHLRDAGAEPACEEWWIFHGLVTPDSRAPVEVCVPFTGNAEPSGEILLRIEPAHTEAYSTVTRDECSFPRIMTAYDAVESYVRDASDLSPTGAVREVYFANFATAAGTDPVAHVAQPIERAAPGPSRRA